VKTAGGNTGLDPLLINADLAVACVRAGLAEVWIGGVHYDAAAIAGASNTTLVSVYTDPNAVIMGAVKDWVLNLKAGLSTMDRLRARALESLVLVQRMIGGYTKVGDTFVGGWWVAMLKARPLGEATYRHVPVPATAKDGFGATEAPRGALMHAIHINGKKIVQYQCIVPTTWNASPKDVNGVNGPMEEAMIGIPYSGAGASFTNQAGGTTTTQGGVEALRVAQSFDPCIACAVH
jgi:Ni,Fe-hydrogenase I large subunit